MAIPDKDERPSSHATPDAIAFPRSPEELRRLLEACHLYRLPIIPHGVDSPMESRVSAARGGIRIVVSQILAAQAEDLAAISRASEPDDPPRAGAAVAPHG